MALFCWELRIFKQVRYWETYFLQINRGKEISLGLKSILDATKRKNRHLQVWIVCSFVKLEKAFR